MILIAIIILIIILVLTIIAAILSLVLQPKAIPPRPKFLDEISVPVAEEDRPVPVLFGTYIFRDPNVIWYGDLDTDPVFYQGGK